MAPQLEYTLFILSQYRNIRNNHVLISLRGHEYPYDGILIFWFPACSCLSLYTMQLTPLGLEHYSKVLKSAVLRTVRTH